MSKIQLKALAYGSFGFSVGFIGLPLYVYLPKYYSDSLGISLFALGIILFISRVIDTVQDPFIGWLSDQCIKRNWSRKTVIKICLPLLMLTFMGLLFPQNLPNYTAWIALFLIMTYTLYSFITINYYTIAAEIYEDYNKQTVLISYREAIALVGITIGSILPSALQEAYDFTIIHFVVWGTYAVTAAVGCYFFTVKSPPVLFRTTTSENLINSVKMVLKNLDFRYLALTFLLSSIAASLPATLVLFYIEDVLGGQQYYGQFLLLYFVFALISIPVWYALSKAYTKRIAWMIGMVITIIVFIWASFLGKGDFIPYAIICVLSGFCLGADLVMPPSILSDLLKEKSNKAKYYGVWGLLGKSSIAFAGSFGLLVLGVLDYQPGMPNTESAQFYLSATYALIPCVVKVFSFIILYKMPDHSKVLR